MPGDEVAAELISELERALEVDPGAGSPTGHGGQLEGLGGGIDREPGSTTLLADPDHGEACARAGDRGALDDRAARVAAGDLDPAQTLRARAHRNDLAEIGDTACEHAACPLPCR